MKTKAKRKPRTTFEEHMTGEEKRLVETIKELTERLTVEKARGRARGMLARFVEEHPLLTRADVKAVLDKMPGGKDAKSTTATLGGFGPIADAIREGRKAKGLSKVELAAKIGMHESSVGLWERGDGKPQPAARKKLAKVLGLAETRFATNGAAHA